MTAMQLGRSMRSLASISEPRDDKVEKEVGLLMAIALGELTRRAQFHLGDLDQEVWSKELLQSFLSEGLRRLAPVLLREGGTSVDITSVSYTHLRAHETKANLVCR